MADILLVDDEESVLRSLKVLLSSEGHEVTAISDSGVVAETLNENSFDLLITDIRMSPLSGMDILKISHELRPDMPALVISAYGSEKTIEQAYSLGCVAYIRKPFSIEEVVTAVESALGAS